jgi:hypothetical protein
MEQPILRRSSPERRSKQLAVSPGHFRGRVTHPLPPGRAPRQDEVLGRHDPHLLGIEADAPPPRELLSPVRAFLPHHEVHLDHRGFVDQVEDAPLVDGPSHCLPVHVEPVTEELAQPIDVAPRQLGGVPIHVEIDRRSSDLIQPRLSPEWSLDVDDDRRH